MRETWCNSEGEMTKENFRVSSTEVGRGEVLGESEEEEKLFNSYDPLRKCVNVKGVQKTHERDEMVVPSLDTIWMEPSEISYVLAEIKLRKPKSSRGSRLSSIYKHYQLRFFSESKLLLPWTFFTVKFARN